MTDMKQTMKSDKYYADVVLEMKDKGLNYVKVMHHLVNDEGLSLTRAWTITQKVFFDMSYAI